MPPREEGSCSRVFLAGHFGKFIGRVPRAPKLHPSLQGAQILEEGGRVGQPLYGHPDQGQEDQVGQVSMGHGVFVGSAPQGGPRKLIRSPGNPRAGKRTTQASRCTPGTGRCYSCCYCCSYCYDDELNLHFAGRDALLLPLTAMMHSVGKRPQTAAKRIILYYEGMVHHVEDESKRQNRAVLL